MHCFTPCDLKATQVTVQCHLIWEFILIKFELGRNARETAKNICCAKGEDAVDQCDDQMVQNILLGFARTLTIRQSQISLKL